MKLSEIYKVIPSDSPDIQFPFPVKKKLNDSIQYMYKQFLYPEKKLKIGRAINLNKSIVLVQKLKPVSKRAQSKVKEYYEIPTTSEVISDEAFLDKYDKYRNSREVETGSKIESREREGKRWGRTF